MKCDLLRVPRQRPIFLGWNGHLDTLEILESDLGRFGTLVKKEPFQKDYDNVSIVLMEISKHKKMLLNFFGKREEIDNNDPNFKFYMNKFKEVFSEESIYYDGDKPEVVQVLDKPTAVEKVINDNVSDVCNAGEKASGVSDGVNVAEKASGVAESTQVVTDEPPTKKQKVMLDDREKSSFHDQQKLTAV
jgi:hypothetical protein